MCLYFFFFKQKTAYEMRISDWSSDVCSSDLGAVWRFPAVQSHSFESTTFALGFDFLQAFLYIAEILFSFYVRVMLFCFPFETRRVPLGCPGFLDFPNDLHLPGLR